MNLILSCRSSQCGNDSVIKNRTYCKMTVSSGQRVVGVCFPSGPVKGWCRPFCIFFSTFTIVMLLLVMSIDLKKKCNRTACLEGVLLRGTYDPSSCWETEPGVGTPGVVPPLAVPTLGSSPPYIWDDLRRQYLPLDAVIWDFEGSLQYSPDLIETIRRDYIQPPHNGTSGSVSSMVPSRQLLKIFKKQRNGVSIECGADSQLSDADWLVENWEWRNLKIQPNPIEIELLRTGFHGASTSHSCISLDITATHTLIQTQTNYPNGTLTAIPCFPLFAMMRAFNATTLDLLILKDVKLPLKILETLPIHDLVNIKVISFVSRYKKNSTETSDACCSEKTRDLLNKWGYTTTSSCPSENTVCYFTCSKWFCPFTLS